ncbi:MAG: MBL fold metallo-hydrolase [Ignavibacteriales bacterium]
MQIHIIASGSKGNAIFLDFGTAKILVDAGISCRRIERGLASVGVKTGDLDAVLITHEHSDHINGLDVLIRKHRIPVYTRPRTWQSIMCGEDFPQECRRALTDHLAIRGVDIKPFRISHDAADPVGFSFFCDQTKCVVATDLGVVTKQVADEMAMADYMVLESNHDVAMLRNGPYPQFLKQRIRSSVGHLSNHDAAEVLSAIPCKSGMQVFLAHLSQQNNHPDLAESTVTDFLSARGCDVGHDIILHRTYQDKLTSLVK